eukprot:1188573-Prorocentrum_minimum.AAC.1
MMIEVSGNVRLRRSLLGGDPPAGGPRKEAAQRQGIPKSQIGGFGILADSFWTFSRNLGTPETSKRFWKIWSNVAQAKPIVDQER